MSTGSGSLTSSGTLYFYLQARNVVGYNLASSAAEIVYEAGDSIILTLPSDCERSGESIERYSISVNTVDSPSTAKVLLDIDRSAITLPATITLSREAHIEIEGVTSTLPTGSDLVNGMLRQLNSTGLVYRYNASSALPADGVQVINAAVGNWESVYDGFDSVVFNTSEDDNGANLNILDIIDPQRVISQYYALDGSEGPSRTYWIKNNTSETISQGTRVGFTVSINNQPASEEFESLLKVIFEGYVDTSTGILDIFEEDGLTPMEDLGVEKEYQFGRTDLILQKPLEPGIAYRVKIFPQFNSYELIAVPTTGTTISVVGFFFDEAGSYNDASALIGNAILSSNPNFRRIYPSEGLSVFADEGSGTVAGFFFNDIGSNVIPGIADNTGNQVIAINNNGSVYLRSSPTLESNEDLRALVSTEPGESEVSPFSSSITADSSPDLTFTVTYPTVISPDYDDVIKGSNKGTFNAEQITIYVRKNSSETRVFSGFSATNTSLDEFTISWDDGVVSIAPTIPFGLFKPSTAPTLVSATTTGTDTYEVAYSFVYLGNSVTGISHKQSDGCIVEQAFSFFEMASLIQQLEENIGYWKEPVSSYVALKEKLSTSLLEGQSNRIAGIEESSYEIWTWDSSSEATADDVSVILPDDLDSSDPGRWIKVSGGSGTESISQIVTAYGEVVVDDEGYVVTSDLGGPLAEPLPSSAKNIITGQALTVTTNLSFTDQSPYAYSINPNGVDINVTLYEGGPFFRKHLIVNRGGANTVTVLDNSASSLIVLNPTDSVEVLWDTLLWRVI